MGETEEFNTLAFEKRLMQLKDTQESIQGMSAWCLKQRSHHKKIVSSWLNVLKRVKMEQRLVLFYLANDVIQYSKRKNYEFVESWGLNLQKATPLVRDEKVRPKILRIFKIWEQRSVYDDEFLSDLTGLLSAGAVKKTDDDPMDFQPQQLVNKIKQCSVLESDTDLRLKYIHESHLQLSDADELCANLKERSGKDDVEKELNEGIACVERYTQALQREIVAREALLALLTSANQYYSTQRGEVKVVAYAYKNFGARVRALKRKLDELIPQLKSSDPSPPRQDEDVPSPGPDEDLDLPSSHNSDAYDIDKTFNTSFADGSLYNMGLSSFLNSDNPLAMFGESDGINMNNTANKIEVLNTRPSEKPDFDVNAFLKKFAPKENTSDNNSVGSGTMSQQSQDALPGLDLLTPESTGNPPPPTSFYGSLDNSVNDEPEPYRPEATWTNNNWNATPAPVPPPMAVFMETPESPPHVPAVRTEPRTVYNPLVRSSPPPSDVDHRGILPPPPPPPVLPILGNMEDIDHRILPNLLTPPPRLNQPPPAVSDVDHRNLISLTSQPPPLPRPLNNITTDQDYRVPPVPPLVAPNDIVESVDMDLSEDEDQQGMYPNQSRHYNNNKVLVGGDSHKPDKTFLRINNPPDNFEREKPLSAPALPLNPFDSNFDREKNEPLLTAPIVPMSNPFDNMPPELKNFNYNKNFNDPRVQSQEDPFEEDLRSRNLDLEEERQDYTDSYNSEWNGPRPQTQINQRFPRNWAPRTNYRPQGFGPQFWPRNGPRPPNNRWMGPRPQRFW